MRRCTTDQDKDRLLEHLLAVGSLAPVVVLDCAGLEMISNSFFSALLQAFRRLQSRPGDIRLCRLGGMAREVFEVMRLERVLPFYDSVEAALADPGPPATPIVVESREGKSLLG